MTPGASVAAVDAPMCGACSHPVGWHPNPGSSSDRNRIGCLECSCSLNWEGALAASSRAAGDPVPWGPVPFFEPAIEGPLGALRAVMAVVQTEGLANRFVCFADWDALLRDREELRERFLEIKRSRTLAPDLEDLVHRLRNPYSGDAAAMEEAAAAIEELGKRNAELAPKNDERAIGWFVVDPDEGVCGAYETEEEAEAARVAMHEPDELEGTELYVAEVAFVGKLRKDLARITAERDRLSRATARVGELEAAIRRACDGNVAARTRSPGTVLERVRGILRPLVPSLLVVFALLVGAPLEVAADDSGENRISRVATRKGRDVGHRWERRRARMCERRLPSLATFCGVDLEAPPTVEEACQVLPILGCDLVDEWEDRTGGSWPCACVGPGLISLPPAPPAPGPVPAQ